MKQWITRISLAVGVAALFLLAGSCNPFDPLAAAGFGDLKIYWVFDRYLGRANLDGSGAETLYTDPSAASYQSVVVDSRNEKIYVADSANSEILQFNMDGSVSNPDIRSSLAPLSVQALAIDPTNNLLYHADGVWIYKIDLETMQESSVGGATVRDMEIDPVRNRLYWCDGNTPSDVVESPPGPLSPTVLYTTAVGAVFDIALDVQGGWLYWIDDATSSLMGRSLTGSDVFNYNLPASSFRGLDVDAYRNELIYCEDLAAASVIFSKGIDGTSPTVDLVTGLGGPASDIYLDLHP